MTTKTKKVAHITPTAELVEWVKATCPFEGCDHKFCAPAIIDPITQYSLKITKCIEMRNGIAWVGKIYKNSKPIINVENDGNGGCNFYSPINSTDGWTEIDAFVASAKEAFPVSYEAEDCLTGFLDAISQTA